jgi:long-chain fatty acid transport protein
MKTSSRFVVAAVAAALALAAASASATNGYFTHGVGTKSKALAGSGSADPQEVLVVATNPAGLAFVPENYEVGLGLFSPMRDYSTSASQLNGQFGSFTIGPNDLSSKNELFFIPYIAKNWKRSDQDSIALSFYARGGMNTEWEGGTATFDPDGPGPAPLAPWDGTYGAGVFGGSGTAGVDLMQAFLNLAYARNSADRKYSIGVAAIFGMQRFEAKGVASFAPYTRTFAASGGTVMPTHLSNNGYDMSYGFGGAVGVQWNPTEFFSMALGYTSEIAMSEFDKYADLFAEKGDFDIPAQLDLGIAIKPTPTITITADAQQIDYHNVASVGNPIQNLLQNCPTASPTGNDLESCLGGSRGGGFGWDDMLIYKVGVAWQYGEDWTFRLGASTGDQPIETDQMSFNILAPAVIEEHYTFGLTHRLASGSEYSVAFMYAPEVKLTGPQNFDPTQTVTFKMHQYELEFSYSWGR